jgi:hypothetical protein
MSRAYKEDQLRKIEVHFRLANPKKSQKEAEYFYEIGGRIVPMWVRVFHASIYNYGAVQLGGLLGFMYSLTYIREYLAVTLWVLIAPAIVLIPVVLPFIMSYRELKKEP